MDTQTTIPMNENLIQRKRAMIERCTAAAKVHGQPMLFGMTTSLILQGVPLPECDLDAEMLHTVCSSTGRRIRRRNPPTHTHVWKQFDSRHLVRINRLVVALNLFLTWAQMADHMDLEQLVILGDSIITAVERNQPAPMRGNGSEIRNRLIDTALGLDPFRGKRTCALAASLLMPNVASPKESEIRLCLLRHGLPMPETNYVVPNVAFRSGAAMTLDLAWPDEHVAVEYDGDQHRTDKRQWRRDQEKRELLRSREWTVIIATADTIPDEASRAEFAWRVARALITNGATFRLLPSPKPLRQVAREQSREMSRGSRPRS